MKKTIKQPIYVYLILSLLIILGFDACKKENNFGTGAPLITKVRTLTKNDSVLIDHQINLDSVQTYPEVRPLPFDSTTNSGKIFTLYAIIGKNLGTTKHIYINGVEIYFNIALATDNTIIFSIPETVPFSSTSTNNKLELVTNYGKIDYNFVVEQPFPGITSIDHLAGNADDLITITGTTFDGLSSVKFGAVNATIVSKTSVKLTVKVPSGLTGPNIISITTTATLGGGTTKGPLASSGIDPKDNVAKFNIVPFGFTQAIYEDGIENSWYNYGWNANQPDNANTSNVLRGKSAIKMQYTGGYDGLGFGTDNGVTGTSIKFSLFADKDSDGKVIHLTLNGNSSVPAVPIVLKGGVWTNYNIPLSFFVPAGVAVPTSVKAIVFQEFSGFNSLFYLDDMGVI